MFFDFCVQTVKSDTVVRYNERKRQRGGLETLNTVDGITVLSNKLGLYISRTIN